LLDSLLQESIRKTIFRIRETKIGFFLNTNIPIESGAIEGGLLY